MKLIKVNVLKEWVENWFTKNRFYHPYAKNNNIPITELYDILEQMPSAQLVIRCRDCKHHEDEELGMVYCPIIVGNWVRDDWYCADAERRTDE